MFFQDTLLDLVARAFILGALGMVWVVLMSASTACEPCRR